MGKSMTIKENRQVVLKDDYLTKIKPFLLLGYGLYKSCKLANIPYSSVNNWIKDDVSFASVIEQLSENVNIQARHKLIEQIKDTNNFNDKAIFYWLSNKDDDFKSKTGSALSVKSGDIDIKIISYK